MSKNSKDQILPIGKIDNSILDKYILKKISTNNKNILLNGSIGGDCSLVKLSKNSKILVISTDPITASKEEIGSLAITVATNDIATEVKKASGILLTVLLPKGTTLNELKKIIDDAVLKSKELNVQIIGGHTEVTANVTSPIITATAFSVKEELKHEEKINKNDTYEIIVTKDIALEGTYLIALEKMKEVKKVLTKSSLKKVLSLKNKLSVLKEGSIIDNDSIKMHDITEGGVLGAAYEVGKYICDTKKINVALTIYKNQIPIHNETKIIADYFKIDPLKLISSGSMLAVVNSKKTKNVIKKLKNNNIKATVIGSLKSSTKNSFILVDNNRKIPIKEPKSDELYKVLK